MLCHFNPNDDFYLGFIQKEKWKPHMKSGSNIPRISQGQTYYQQN